MRRTRTRHPSTGAGMLGVLAAMALVIPVAAWTGPTDTWTARLGTSGANGLVSLTTTATTGTLKLALKGLAASATYPIRIGKGTCDALGVVIWTAPAQTSTAGGRLARSLTIPAAKVISIRTALAVGDVVIRVGTRGGLRCGVFTGRIPTPACGQGWTCVPSAGIALVLPPGWSEEAPGGSELFRASAGAEWARFVIEDGERVLTEAGLEVPASLDDVAASYVAMLEDPDRTGFTRYSEIATRHLDLPAGPAVRISYMSATAFILVTYQTTVSVWSYVGGHLIVMELMTSFGEGDPGDPSIDPPGLAELLHSVQEVPASAMPPTPSSAPTTGRLELPRIGFAITLPEGWARVIDGDIGSTTTGDSFLARELASTADPRPTITVQAVPTYAYPSGEDPQKATADDVDALVGIFTDVVGTRTVVGLSAGDAIRLEWVYTEDDTPHPTAGIRVAYVIGGGTRPGACHADPVLHLLTANADGPDVERYRATFDEMARSFAHIPAAPGACGPVGGSAWTTPVVTWGSPEPVGRTGDRATDLVGWERGFVAVGSGCPEVVDSQWSSCPSGARVIVWSSSSGEEWQRTVLDDKASWFNTWVERAFGGLVLVNGPLWSGPATIWTSRDGRAWAKVGQIDAATACPGAGTPRQAFDVDGVSRRGSWLYVSGAACVGDEPGERIVRSSDGIHWVPVKAVPAGAAKHGVPIGTTGPTVTTGDGDEHAAVARAGSWYLAAAPRSGNPALGTGTTWLWASPDGTRWRELPNPAAMGLGGSLFAGWGDRVALFTVAGSDDMSWDAWVGAVAAP
jgi:hypothetical protein